jgi:hypothetical protein
VKTGISMDMLQAMIILTQTKTGSPLEIFQLPVLENVLSIFITAAILRLVQGLILFVLITDYLDINYYF